MIVSPAAGSTSPLSKAGLAVKGYGQRAPIKTSNGKWTGQFHAGVDITAPEGDLLVAAVSGTVVATGWAGSGLAVGRSGMFVLIRSGAYDIYTGHMSYIGVRAGQHVVAGQPSGAVGSTGNVTGPHVHVEVRYAGTTTTLDPIVWFAARGVTLGADSPNPSPTAEDPDMAFTDAQAKQLATLDANVKLLMEWMQTSAGPTYLWQIRQDTARLLGRDPGAATDPAALAADIVAAMGKDMAKQVVQELGRELTT
ncbi:M23 family metallopeptidase [Occultella kanbiaonis]|uniref:M23 family metallopeptidase n=1 Tax=Occultella kanbiaonis TaxID=2675754 RepID=UPI0012B8C495|nr:M23 family metallopeptidase [Occultella kanbiaonis]